MADPDRTLLILGEIRDELRLMRVRMDLEFGEVQDRLTRIDERVDAFIAGYVDGFVQSLEEGDK